MLSKIAGIRRKLNFILLKYAIKKYEKILPIIISEDGIVLDGNNRLTAAKQLGIKKIPVFIVKGETKIIDVKDLEVSFPVDLRKIGT